jgi:hypothetical protein
MPEEADARPFAWGEIKDRVKERIAELEKTIGAENGNRVNLALSPGATRQRISELLCARADGWADRAANIYRESLVQIGREDAPGASLSVWLNGLCPFIDETLRKLLFATCGFGLREYELLRSRSRKNQKRPDTLITQETAFGVHLAVNRVMTRLEPAWADQAFVPQVDLIPAGSNPLLPERDNPSFSKHAAINGREVHQMQVANVSSPESSTGNRYSENEDRALVRHPVPAATPAKSPQKRAPRIKEPCYDGAANIIKENPEIDLHRFCIQMDRRAAQNQRNAKYLPPKNWRVRSFLEQKRKRPNTVSSFMSRVRTRLRADGFI